MGTITLTGLGVIFGEIAATGTYTIPTGHPFTATDGSEYEVVIVEGAGSVDITSKTQNDFDVTTTGGVRFMIIPNLPADKAHID